MSREENKERDKDRPVIVHCIGLLVQHATACDDDDAIEAAWNIFDYFGNPDTLPLPKNVVTLPVIRVERY